MGDESCNIDLIGLFLLSLHLPTLAQFASTIANPTPRITGIKVQDQYSGSRFRTKVKDPGSVDVYDGMGKLQVLVSPSHKRLSKS